MLSLPHPQVCCSAASAAGMLCDVRLRVSRVPLEPFCQLLVSSPCCDTEAPSLPGLGAARWGPRSARGAAGGPVSPGLVEIFLLRAAAAACGWPLPASRCFPWCGQIPAAQGRGGTELKTPVPGAGGAAVGRTQRGAAAGGPRRGQKEGRGHAGAP